MRVFLTSLMLWAVACGVEGTDAGWEGDADEDFWDGSSDGRIRLDHVSWDVDVFDALVSGCLEVSMVSATGSDLSASVRFALPPGAVIHRAEALLASTGRWEPAETMGRREAGDVYEDVVNPRPPQDPLLIQQVGPSSYRARAYPVGIDQPLSFRACYAHPRAPGQQGQLVPIVVADPTEPLGQTASEVDVVVRMHEEGWIGTAWSSRLGAGRLGGSEATFHATQYPLDLPLSLQMGGASETSPLAALTYDAAAEGVPDHLFVRWLPDLSEYPAATSIPRAVVFVIDSSGSMDGAKMVETRRTVTAALRALAPGDRFGLVDFDSDVATFRDEMSGVDDLADAIAWVEGIDAGGDTAMADGLRAAAGIGESVNVPIDVLLVTDGRPTRGPETSVEILAEVAAASPAGRSPRIFAVGIGSDLDQALLSDLAVETGGEATLALEDSEIAPQVLEMFDRVRRGGLEDVEVELAGGGIEDAQTFTWARLFAGTPLTVAATGTELLGPITLRLRATVNGEAVEIDRELTPLRGGADVFLLAPPLAATAWAEQMNRTIDRVGETSGAVGDAVVLAKHYGIVGRYSAMLALETDEMYADYGIDQVDRDPAGIALDPVSASTADESRVGGEGVVDTGDSEAGDWDGGAASSACACRAAARRGGASVLALAMLLALLLARRRV